MNIVTCHNDNAHRITNTTRDIWDLNQYWQLIFNNKQLFIVILCSTGKMRCSISKYMLICSTGKKEIEHFQRLHPELKHDYNTIKAKIVNTKTQAAKK